jgi:hypothetical protein
MTTSLSCGPGMSQQKGGMRLRCVLESSRRAKRPTLRARPFGPALLRYLHRHLSDDTSLGKVPLMRAKSHDLSKHLAKIKLGSSESAINAVSASSVHEDGGHTCDITCAISTLS